MQDLPGIQMGHTHELVYASILMWKADMSGIYLEYIHIGNGQIQRSRMHAKLCYLLQ